MGTDHGLKIGVVIPTIPGRESSLDRCIESYREHTRSAELIFAVRERSSTCGEGWMAGAIRLERYGGVHYLHLTCDDIEAIDSSWWRAAIQTCDQGKLPAPIIRTPSGGIESAGGKLGAPNNLITDIGPDWSDVDFTTLPFLSWSQWKRIGMIKAHYATDVWVSYRGRQLGIPTVLRHSYTFKHHQERAGRGAGMSQGARDAHDRALMHRELERHQT